MKQILSNESEDVADWWLFVIMLSTFGFCDREFLDQLINCKVFEEKCGCGTGQCVIKPMKGKQYMQESCVC